MEERELPAGWDIAPLGELSEIIRGITFPASAKEGVKSGSNVCCLRTSNVQAELIWNDVFYVDRAFVKRPDQLVRVGDILMSMANSYELVGKVSVAKEVPQEAAFGAFLAAIRPLDVSDGRYLFYFLRSESVQRQIRAGSSQTTNIANISAGKLREIIAPLAPLNEQRRIAAKLDTTLAAVDACRQRLDGVAELLKRFRQAVLAAATSGELTREWREERGMDGDWPEVQLGDHAEGFNYGTSAKSQSEGEIPVLRMGNIQAGEIDWQDLVYTSDLAEIAKYMLDPGDVLFNRTNSPELVGKTAIYRGEQPAIYAGYLIRVRCSVSLDPEFLNLSLNSPRARDYCWRVKSDGVSQSNINAKKLAAYTFDLPSIEEQQEIVRRAQDLFTLADQLEARLSSARKVVDRLTPALLAKAFRGELVPQDPTDEPASVLLERIRAARQAEAGAGKPSRRGRKKAAAHPDPTSLGLDSQPSAVASDPVPPDQLAMLLQECGPLSEKALLAASELEPGRFIRQLQLELQAGTIREELEEGERVLVGG